MKSYNKLIVAVVLTLVIPMIALVVIRNLEPTPFPDDEVAVAPNNYTEKYGNKEDEEWRKWYPRGSTLTSKPKATFTLPPGIELVKPGLSKPVQGTPINMAAFCSRPDLAQQLRNLPPGTRVPLIGTMMDGLPNTVEWATGIPFKPSQFYGGLKTDNTGQVYYADGRPAGPELGQFIQHSITIGRALSNATTDVSRTFDEVQAGTAARRGQLEDRIFSIWSDTTLSINHFIWQGEEYEVDSLYAHAIGPDDLLYRAEDASHFNSNFRVIDPNVFYRNPGASY